MTRDARAHAKRAHTPRERRSLRRFLGYHGFLRTKGTLKRGLTSFQTWHGLEPSGELDAATRRLLTASRCAWPILGEADSSSSWPAASKFLPPVLATSEASPSCEYISPPSVPRSTLFEFIGARWKTRNLGVALVGGMPQRLGNAGRMALISAFKTWNRTQIVNLEPSEDQETAAIRVLWISGPGGGDPFYGPGGIVARGYYPFFDLGALAGDLHLELEEPWTLDGGGLDLETVVLHEVGHCLGLGHCRDPESVMYPQYHRLQRRLHPQDVAELEWLYEGVPGPVLAVS
jgi:hypothetical protein